MLGNRGEGGNDNPDRILINEFIYGLRNGFKEGVITKEEYSYAFTLREHQNARNETESEARQMWRTICARIQNQRVFP